MTRAILLFLIVAYALAGGLSLAIGLTGGSESPYIALGFAAMVIPAVAVGITWIVTKEAVGINWERFPMRYVLIAILLMPLVMHAAMLPTMIALEGHLPWESWLYPAADGLRHAPPSRGWGTLTTTGLLARLGLNAAIGLVVMSFLALFEEVGWRVWLLPRLAKKMSRQRAVLIGAALWATWHVPYALAGIHHLDGVPGAITAVVMAIGISGSGIVLGWLWFRTESIWIVVLAHAALNNWGQYAFKFMQSAANTALLSLVAGNIALLVVGIGLLGFDLRKDNRRLGVQTIGSADSLRG